MSDKLHHLFRALPSMTAVLDAVTGSARPECAALAAGLPRALLRESIESFLGECREAIKQRLVTDPEELALPVLLPRLVHHVGLVSRPHFRRVLNATGVVIHTNLGRSLLAPEALRAVEEAGAYYSNLEFDLASGVRGSRYSHVEDLICKLTGAERALVVNNNAAAVLLVLDTLCKGREVVVSRGQLVEIGGSFRIPEVMEKSGCILKEVGATNRTHLHDFASALNENTAALMKVHTSNFRIIGFTNDVPREELAGLAHSAGLPLIEDLGSGSFFDFTAAGLPYSAAEPTPARTIAGGVDVVTFSGDKVLGGPQAGIIAGTAAYIERIKKNPLNRALRIDKLTLAALEATLRLYLDPETAKTRIPTLRMICMTEKELKVRARKLVQVLEKETALHFAPVSSAASGTSFAPDAPLTQPTPVNPSAQGGGLRIQVRPGASRSGGGALPEYDLPTHLVCIQSSDLSPDSLRARLLNTDPPMVARVEDNALCLDPRTLDTAEFALAAKALVEALTSQS